MTTETTAGYNGQRWHRALAAGLLLLGSAAAAPVYAAQTPAELSAQNARVKVHPHTGKLRFIGARRDAPIAVSGAAAALPETVGWAAVRQFGPLFGLTRPDRQASALKHTTKRHGGSRHRYRQIHEGIPVLAGELLINLDDAQRLTAMIGEVSPALDLDIRPELNRVQARRMALETTAKWYTTPKRKLKASTPELWIVDPKLLVSSDRDPSLTWRIQVTDRATPHSIRELLFIDAHTGGVSLRVNLIENAKNRETYSANNSSSLPGTLVCNESDPTCAAGDADAQAAHIYAGDTYDFYAIEHGRDSLDDAGQVLVSTVNYSSFICPNAFWDGAQMVYCNGFSLADDVVGHELTHGVTEHSSNLFYYYQSGAINESFSDLWGEFVDLTNAAGDDSAGTRWQMGEDLPPGVGVIRDMADPTIYFDPDKMSSPWYHTSSSDNGGVHSNSGINNKAVYLMTDGGTFNGYVVNGIGIGKVADIYYEAQTNLLVSGSDYADLYVALNQGCLNLIGTDPVNPITAADCIEVQNATDAVEMNSAPQGLNPEAQVCPANQSPTDLFFDDIENGTVNWVFNTLSGDPGPVWGVDGGYTASGQFSLWGQDTFPSTDSVAEMVVDVPLPTVDTAYLHFKHSFGFELGQAPAPGTYWDGGWLEYSTDGGSNWIDAGPLIDSGQAYNGTIYNNPANPNVGHPIFGDESRGYVSTRLDLSSLAAQNIRFRWRISTDFYVSGPLGWELDDVRVYTCNQAPQIQTVTADPATLNDAATSDLTVSATDPDGPQALSYTWSVNPGEGTILNPDSPNATYVPPNVSTGQTFTIAVQVDDGINVSDATVNVTVQDADGGIPPSQIGVSRESQYFYFDASGNGHWDGVSGSDGFQNFGLAALRDLATPLVGDWDGDGLDETGLYYNGNFYLDTTGNGSWDLVSGGDTFREFGITVIRDIAIPVVGDWNGDGIDDLGLYNDGYFYLDTTGNGVWDAVSGGDTFRDFGITAIRDTAVPVVGDWNGDGADDLGVYDQGYFYLDTTGNGVWDSVGGGDTFRDFGLAVIRDTATPVIGDWDSDGIDDLGLYNEGFFYLDTTGNGRWDSVSGGDTFYEFGLKGIPVTFK